MNLLELRQKVQRYGFDSRVTTTDVNEALNDAQSFIASRVNYYIAEATQAISTVAGTAMYAFPTDFARARELFDSVRNIQLTSVTLAEIDRSSSTTKGPPFYYALDGANVHLFPPPDGVYSLELRYWKLPAALVNDTDTPTIPPGWHHLLWRYAVSECYKQDDDPQMGASWRQDFDLNLAEFAADVKFPDTDRPAQAKGMWDQGDSLRPPGGWSPYLYG